MWVCIYHSQFFLMVSYTLPYQESLRINALKFFLIMTAYAKQETLYILKYFSSFLLYNLLIITLLINKICVMNWQTHNNVLTFELHLPSKPCDVKLSHIIT